MTEKPTKVFRFKNVPVYRNPGKKTIDAIHILTDHLKFTKQYYRIMDMFGKASRAGWRCDVVASADDYGNTVLSGEIEVPAHG